ncbi:MAG TPA: hypothetical protein VLF69_06275 [Candidatus Saccharimonadales bacterium]|nr:hypothetical protein [Candidatus Saccharimonadales bacterium]
MLLRLKRVHYFIAGTLLIVLAAFTGAYFLYQNLLGAGALVK